MRGLLLSGDYAPKPGYTLSGRELDGDHRALNGSAIWKNSTLVVRNDVPMPVVGPHDILMKVKYCGVCGSDVHFYESDADGYILFPGHSKLPLVIGHEFSGEVVETGSAVRHVAVGDMVTAEGMDWCGECTPCRAGYFNQCQNLEELGFTVEWRLRRLRRLPLQVRAEAERHRRGDRRRGRRLSFGRTGRADRGHLQRHRHRGGQHQARTARGRVRDRPHRLLRHPDVARGRRGPHLRLRDVARAPRYGPAERAPPTFTTRPSWPARA